MPDPVNAMRSTAGLRTRAAPASPSPGRNASAAGRHAGLVKGSDQLGGGCGRLLGGLQHDRVACREGGSGHPGRDREGKVPRRDYRGDAAAARSGWCCARPVPERAARPQQARSRRRRSRSRSRSPRRRRRRPLPRASRTHALRAPQSRGDVPAAALRLGRACRRAAPVSAGPTRGPRRPRAPPLGWRLRHSLSRPPRRRGRAPPGRWTSAPQRRRRRPRSGSAHGVAGGYRGRPARR